MSVSEQPSNRLAYKKSEICELFGISGRTFDRLRAAGSIPKPDRWAGNNIQMWSHEVVNGLFRTKPKGTPRRRGAVTIG
jgi:hypothetical protein